MRPAPEEREARRTTGSSLARRVAIGTALAAALAALIASIVALFAADRLVLDAEDRRLRGAAAVVLREIVPPLAATPDGERAALQDALVEEETELAVESIRIAVRDSAGLVGGDPQLPLLADGTCRTRDMPGFALRACAVREGQLQVVAEAARAPRNVAGLVLSGLAAVAAAAIVASVLARRASRWALAPLTVLRDSLDRIALDDPRTAALASDDACREVAALRAALAALLARLAESFDTARRFSADAAHELKTPLTVIRGELDLLSEEPLDPLSRRSVEKLRLRASG